MSDIRTFYKYDLSDDRHVIHRSQDCEPIVDEVKRIKEVSDGRSETGLGYFVGRIPGIIVEQYLKEKNVTMGEFINDDSHVKNILSNPDYKKFRVFEGKM